MNNFGSGYENSMFPVSNFGARYQTSWSRSSSEESLRKFDLGSLSSSSSSECEEHLELFKKFDGLQFNTFSGKYEEKVVKKEPPEFEEKRKSSLTERIYIFFLLLRMHLVIVKKLNNFEVHILQSIFSSVVFVFSK